MAVRAAGATEAALVERKADLMEVVDTVEVATAVEVRAASALL